MQWDFLNILEQAKTEAQAVNSPQALEAFRLKYLGKKGLVADIFASLGKADGADKAAIGKGANDLRNLVEGLIAVKSLEMNSAKTAGEQVDMSLPGTGEDLGHTHIL